MTAVVWVGPDPHWDEGIIRELTASEEWQHCRKVPLGEGAVIVVPGQHHAWHASQLAQSIALLPWALTIVTSDEEALFPLHLLPRDDRHVVWGQYHARPEFERVIPIGAPPNTPWMHDDRPRDLAVSFVGQNTHARREELLDTIKGMAYESGNGNIAWLATTGFRQGLERDEYLATLARTRIAPCPSGPHSLDSFRLYEALACGALPVIETHTPHGFEDEFWRALFGGRCPIPVLDSWERLPSIAERYADEDRWELARDQVAEWWQDYRSGLARDFADTIFRLRES